MTSSCHIGIFSIDGCMRINELLYCLSLYPADLVPNLALFCLLVRMTFDQSSGHGNPNHFLIVICMHLLGKGEL